MQRFDIQKLNNMKVKKQYQVKITNRFRAFKNLDENMNISMAQESIRENTKISAEEFLGQYELLWYKQLFDEDYSELLDKRQHAKLLWLQM